MINPPGEDILDAPDLASLNLHPPPVQSLPPSLPYMVDEYLNQNTIAAAYQRFVADLSFVHTPGPLHTAFEHVVLMIRESYSAAINNMKIAEIINKERIRSAKEQIRSAEERFRDHEKFFRAQHETEHQSEINMMVLRHEADIAMARAELRHEADMLKAKLEMADHRVALLEEDIALARHKHIESSMQTGSLVVGSVGRHTNWKNAIDAGIDDEPLPIPNMDGRILEKDVKKLVNTTFESEPDMYTPVTNLLTRLLRRKRKETDPGVQVFDTHRKCILGAWKPDICICVDGTKTAPASGIYVAIELKHTDHSMIDEDRGQVLDYLVAMLKLDPNRAMVAGLLSDLNINHVIVLRARENGGTQLIQHKTASFAEVLTFIKQVILVDLQYRPAESAFPAHLGYMERRLGHPRASVVAEFLMPDPVLSNMKSQWPTEVKSLGKSMAVKVLLKPTNTLVDRTQRHEVEIYKLIQNFSPPSTNIVRLVYSSPDNRILGTAPVGSRIDVRGISDHQNLRTILTDVLDGLNWLHSIGVLHRDIRRDNIIVVSTPGSTKLHGKIIDFGTAIIREEDDDTFLPQIYHGGYICCPYEIIGDFKRPYTPAFAHDLLAWVMLVNFLVFPNGVPYLQSHRVAFESVEAERLIAYWYSMRTSRTWGRFVGAAEAVQRDQLATLMADLVVML